MKTNTIVCTLIVMIAISLSYCNKDKEPKIPSELALFYQAKDSMLIQCQPIDNSSQFSIEFEVNGEKYCSPRIGEEKSTATITDLVSTTTTSPTLNIQFDSVSGSRRLFKISWDSGYRYNYEIRDDKDRWIPFLRLFSGYFPLDYGRLNMIRESFSNKDTFQLSPSTSQRHINEQAFFQLYCNFCTQTAYDIFPESKNAYSHINLSPSFCENTTDTYMLIEHYKEVQLSPDSVQIEVELSFEFDLCHWIYNAENPYYGRVTDGKIKLKFVEEL